jgi:hypothetical protein
VIEEQHQAVDAPCDCGMDDWRNSSQVRRIDVSAERQKFLYLSLSSVGGRVSKRRFARSERKLYKARWKIQGQNACMTAKRVCTWVKKRFIMA